ncbi:MAG: trehalase family glycosidase [Acidobacteriota bacterium]
MRIQIPVETTFQRLLAQEDTDGDNRITVNDRGPRRFQLCGRGGESYLVEGTYPLSNLLQELALAHEEGSGELTLETDRLHENPVRRLSRLIRDSFWDGLTRTVDAEGLARTVVDSKGEGTDLDRGARVYVPYTDPQALDYFDQVAASQPDLGLEVTRLPERVTPEYVRRLNDRPGVLSLVLVESSAGRKKGLPFVVPGGRFNELYGWDSYFEALGLLVDGRVALAKAMVDHFLYEIRHYGQILNANRSYYLTRSQPPFLTSMGLAVYDHLPRGKEAREWLGQVMRAAIREYETVWMAPPKLTSTGLSRYYGNGIGMPPETEEGHYDSILQPYAEAAGMEVRAYARALRHRQRVEPALDAYFVHDRALRESGHDNSYRLEGRAAHLNTVDLNALLYKYEIDIARTIQGVFGDALSAPDGRLHQSGGWWARAEKRKTLINQWCWNAQESLFLDYDLVQKAQTGFQSVTTFYTLWAGLATRQQARALLTRALPLFEVAGGLVSTTEASRGPLSDDRPQRQWDYPFGWPPHQMLAWQGLVRYGYQETAQRLAYRWLLMITQNARDYNGTIPEKYDVVNRTHNVFVEYGNVGADFDYITREGFGWMNASYQVGLTLLTPSQRALLEAGRPTEEVFGQP